MGKYTKKRNCRKNKSMKKGGNDDQNGSKDEVRPVEKPESSSDSTSEAQPVAQVAPSGEPSKTGFSIFSPSSWFSSSKSTTGGRKNKQRKSKSKSKK